MFIGNVNPIDTIQIGGRTFTNLTGLIILHAILGTSITSTFRKNNGVAGYAVTAAKTLTVLAWQVDAKTAAGGFQIFYENVDEGMNNGSPALTGAVYFAGTQTNHIFLGPNVGVNYYYVNALALAGKFLSLTTDGSVVGGWVTAFCSESLTA